MKGAGTLGKTSIHEDGGWSIWTRSVDDTSISGMLYIGSPIEAAPMVALIEEYAADRADAEAENANLLGEAKLAADRSAETQRAIVTLVGGLPIFVIGVGILGVLLVWIIGYVFPWLSETVTWAWHGQTSVPADVLDCRGQHWRWCIEQLGF